MEVFAIREQNFHFVSLFTWTFSFITLQCKLWSSNGKKLWKEEQKCTAHIVFKHLLYAIKLWLKNVFFEKTIALKTRFSIAILQHIEKYKWYFKTMHAVRFCSSFHSFFPFDEWSLHWGAMNANVQVKKWHKMLSYGGDLHINLWDFGISWPLSI